MFDPKPQEIVIGYPDSFLFACGKNENLELSFRGYKYIGSPSGLKITKEHKIIEVSCGANHTALLTEFGYVFMLGSSLHQKLGIDIQGNTNIGRPTKLPLSEQRQVIQVSCGDYHTLALIEDGTVWGWGGTWHKKIGDRNPKPSLVKGLS